MHHFVVHRKFVSDGRPRTEIVARKSADSRFRRIENIGAEKFLFEICVSLGEATTMSGVIPPPPVTCRPLSVSLISVG